MDSFLTIKIEISIYRRLPGYEQRIQTHPSIRTVMVENLTLNQTVIFFV